MPRSVHTGFLIAIMGAVTISPMSMARAQDVKSLCARVTNDDRVRPIPITLVPPARQLFSFSDSAPDKYIQKSPGSDVVPMAATGHGTIYEWTCQGKTAVISKQVETVDPRGFITENWKQLD